MVLGIKTVNPLTAGNVDIVVFPNQKRQITIKILIVKV